nr:toll/interleukin-1 receptor domain-containing protein [uncultured Lachnoclostridium sp.]
MSVFISFSGASREEYAIQFLNFFNKYGLHCWYDQHELFLGDELHKTIIKQGISQSKYCVLIINQAFLNSNWPCEEAHLFFKRFKSGEDITIFPILLDITKKDLANSKINFLLKIKYQFLHAGESIDQIAFQIINRVFFDIAKQCSFSDFKSLLKHVERLSHNKDIDLYNALITLKDFDETDYRSRTIFLICLIRLFHHNPFEKTIRNISYLIYDNYKINFDIYKTVESILLIIASQDFNQSGLLEFY